MPTARRAGGRQAAGRGGGGGARGGGGGPPRRQVRAWGGVGWGVLAAGARGGACAPLVET
ncbi:hypothetical protein GSH05_33595, partial [Burkholderia pseudomallei]|nr:hypothetical protein [Burkholderia pseudomallei]